MTNPDETWTIAVTADTSQIDAELKRTAQLGRQFSSALITAFEGIAIKGRSLTDVMKGLALSLSRMVLQAAFKPLEQGLGQMFSGLFSGFAGSAFGFARGAALNAGTPVPFAHGGVIASPVTFPLSGGRTGLAGERGAEAIMPLARGSDGRLGVAALGGGSAASITVNITTPDIDGFKRSEGQVAAMLARAVALGQRNL
jgi:phage-related minor tail protein